MKTHTDFAAVTSMKAPVPFESVGTARRAVPSRPVGAAPALALGLWRRNGGKAGGCFGEAPGPGGGGG